jgi:TolA-binding protein
MDTNDREKDTLPMLETLVEVVNAMQQQMNAMQQQMSAMQQQMNAMQQEMNARFEDVRLQLMSVDVRLDRMESMEHKALSIAYDVRADVRVMREEINAWSKEVMSLKV